jgi:predicted RNA binding protein YcfA (HicA-like mRNA interferase family)
MPGLPAQIPWRRFVCVLRKLGYSAKKGKAGSARSFTNPNRVPNVVSLHEPHPGQSMRRGMLQEYLRKLLLEDEFLQLLEDC